MGKHCGREGGRAGSKEKFNRRWIGCDISKYSIYLTCKRLINFHEKNQENSPNYFPIEIFTRHNKTRDEIIKSGFFEKEIIINRKK